MLLILVRVIINILLLLLLLIVVKVDRLLVVFVINELKHLMGN